MPVYLTEGTVQELGLRQRKAMNMCLCSCSLHPSSVGSWPGCWPAEWQCFKISHHRHPLLSGKGWELPHISCPISQHFCDCHDPDLQTTIWV